MGDEKKVSRSSWNARIMALATYVPFTDYRKDVAKYGTYSVHFQARFYPTPSAPFAVQGSSISVDYDPTPAYPNYIDWLFAKFSTDKESNARDNGTSILTVHVVVDKIFKEKTRSNLFDKTYYVFPYEITSGRSYVLNETFGPFLASNSSLPMKVVYTISMTGINGLSSNVQGAYYVTSWKP